MKRKTQCTVSLACRKHLIFQVHDLRILVKIQHHLTPAFIRLPPEESIIRILINDFSRIILLKTRENQDFLFS